MNIWAKMMTALRGGVNEAGEAIVDTQALRILDQEVRDATEELKYSKKVEQASTVLKRIIAKLVGKKEDEKLLCQSCSEIKEIQSLSKLLQ